jgi:hypothetical protein
MPHYNASTRLALMSTHLGIKVDRDTATLPQGTSGALFNIVGGRVAMTQILGEVTTVIGGNASNHSLQMNPTTGTTSPICAVVASASKEAGTLISITGTVGDAMLADDAGGVGMQSRPVALPVGDLELLTSGNNTGSIKWSMWYVPIDDGAYVTAA